MFYESSSVCGKINVHTCHKQKESIMIMSYYLANAQMNLIYKIYL